MRVGIFQFYLIRNNFNISLHCEHVNTYTISNTINNVNSCLHRLENLDSFFTRIFFPDVCAGAGADDGDGLTICPPCNIYIIYSIYTFYYFYSIYINIIYFKSASNLFSSSKFLNILSNMTILSNSMVSMESVKFSFLVFTS